MSNDTMSFTLSILAIVAATVLAMMHVISGEVWIAFLLGAVVPSPMSRIKPPSPPMPAAMLLLLLLLGGCKAEVDWPWGPTLAADHVTLSATSSSPIAAGEVGIWASSSVSPSRAQFVASDGSAVYAGQARDLISSAGAPSGVAEGNIWYDSALHRPRYRDNSGTMDFAAAGTPAAHASTHLPGGADALTVAAPVNIGTANAAGAAASFSRSDHVHALTFAILNTILGGASASIAVNSQKITALTPGTASGEAVAAQRSISVTAPLTGGGDLTANRSIGLSYSGDFDVGGGALIMKPGSLVYQAVSGGGTGVLGAATVYLGGVNTFHGGTEYYLGVATRAGTARALRCYLQVAPGGADTVIFTARINAADSTLTCTITGAAVSCNDTTHAPSVAAGDRLSTKAVSSAGTAASATCSFEVTN